MQRPIVDISKLGQKQEGETAWLKAPLMLPNGMEITHAAVGGYHCVIHQLPVVTPKGTLGVPLNFPTGLVVLSIVSDDGPVSVTVPIADVRMITQDKDFPRVFP